jgi:NDP-sugar pyrophosphorylase family protein
MTESRVAIDAPVVIMAGGEGSRLAPYTKVLPKPLLPVGETPMVELVIERFQEYGCTDFILSVNYMADLIKTYFADISRGEYQVRFIEEDVPLGTAGSLRLLDSSIERTFFLSNCDTLIDADYSDILRFHKEGGHEVTIVAATKHFTVPYGVCEMGEGGLLARLREKPAFDFLVNTGFYVLEPGVVDDIPDGRVFHVTDLVDLYVGQGRRVGVYPVSEDSWVDMGHLEDAQAQLKRFGMP